MRNYKRNFNLNDNNSNSFFSRFFGNKEFAKLTLSMMLPAIAQSLISIAVLYVDNFSIVSLWHIKSEANSAKTALGLAEPLVAFATMTIIAWLSGSGIMMSQYFGNKDFKGTRQTLSYRLYTSYILLTPLIIVLATKTGDIIHLVSSSGNEADKQKAITYLFFSSFTLIPTISAYVLSFSLQETKRPMISFIAALVGMITNIILDPLGILLVQKLNLSIDYAVMLLALSTGMARIVQTLVVFCYIIKNKGDPLYFFKELKIDLNVIKKIFKHQFVVFINDACYGLCNLLLIICLMRNNPIYQDEMTNVGLIFQFTSIIWPGMASATALMIGAQLGAGHIKQAKRNATILIRWGITICIGLAIILFGLSFGVNHILSPDASIEKLERSMHLEWVLAPIIISQGLFSITYYAMRTGGSKAVLFGDGFIMAIWTVVFCALVFTNTTKDLNPLLYLFLLESNQIVKMIVSYILYKKVNWARRLTGTENTNPLSVIEDVNLA